MDINFKVDDLVLPITIRFNRAVKAFVEELTKKLANPGVQCGSPEYDQNGFIKTITLFKTTPEEFLGVSINPRVNGKFDYSCYKNGEVKLAEYEDVSLISFWTDSEDGCFKEMKKLFEPERVEAN